jgi:polyhydroxyalkanoate synthesis regulator phasin
MIEGIKKALLAGLGAIVMTKDRIQTLTQKMVEEGKLTKEEAEKFSQELLEDGKKEWEHLQEKMGELFYKGTSRLNFATQEEFEVLKERVYDLERRMNRLEEDQKDR